MNDEQLESERVAWNRWNAEHREASQGRISLEQADLIEGWLQRLFPRGGASLLEVGCGTGWMSERLAAYGRVTGVDLADEVIERAQARAPHVTFVAGNFLHANVGSAPFDAVVAMEAMAHFSDQEAFVRRVAALLRPGGSVLLATQNRPMMERNIRHLPNRGWHRRWVDQDELRALLEPYFLVNELRSITPTFFSGPLHLLNARATEALAKRIGLGRPLRAVKRLEEARGLGWSLVCSATKRD